MIKMRVERVETAVPITILKLEGELDASCYRDVIDEVHNLYRGGMRHLLLDLGELVFMASSGLVALHSISLIMRGEQPPDPEAGWGAFHAISDDVEAADGRGTGLKLLNPRPSITKTLKLTGFDNLLAIYNDRETAVASFSA